MLSLPVLVLLIPLSNAIRIGENASEGGERVGAPPTLTGFDDKMCCCRLNAGGPCQSTSMMGNIFGQTQEGYVEVAAFAGVRDQSPLQQWCCTRKTRRNARRNVAGGCGGTYPKPVFELQTTIKYDYLTCQPEDDDDSELE